MRDAPELDGSDAQQPDVRALSHINTIALESWMDQQGLSPSGPISSVRAIGGGTQNILLRFERGGNGYVLRRGPLHLRERSNQAILREVRVQAALDRTDVPHPTVIAACSDPSVLDGAVFYLMEPVAGFNPIVTLPERHTAERQMRHAMGLAAVDAAAAVARVDVDSTGLDDFGKPEGFLERQVERWLSELESYSRYAGYSGPRIPGLDAVARWLEANCPSSGQPGLSHGDYHFGNLMFSFEGPQVEAVVDWEMSTIGDPLVDLGWLLATWPSNGAASVGGVLGSAGGLPTPSQVVHHYAVQVDRDLSAIVWYEVLACFKLGIILEGTHARAAAGKAPRATGDRLHALTLALFARALDRSAAS